MGVTTPANNEPLVCNEEKMRYRPLGKTGLKISALAFGCMRLRDDEEYNKKLISTAIDYGVNYFETTRFYLGGTCQHRTAPGLAGKTAGVIVSGKDSISPDKTASQFRREMERQLDILGLTHFKFYQVGWFSWGMIPHLLKPGGVLDAIRRAKEEGLVQYVGFTGHDVPENFIRCIETGLFDCLTIPYSLIQRTNEPTIKRAGELGVGVIAMCPVAGGILACESDKMKKALKMDMPTTEMALRFVLSNPDVSAACSGMTSMEQLEQNVKTVKAFDPEKDNAFEQICEGVERMKESLGTAICTGCSYCMPCEQGVDIPRHLELYRNWKCFGLDETVKEMFKTMPADQNASNCNECGACEEKCPNSIQIRETLKEILEWTEA